MAQVRSSIAAAKDVVVGTPAMARGADDVQAGLNGGFMTAFKRLLMFREFKGKGTQVGVDRFGNTYHEDTSFYSGAWLLAAVQGILTPAQTARVGLSSPPGTTTPQRFHPTGTDGSRE